MKLTILFLFLLHTSCAFAQDSVYIISAGTKVNGVIPTKEQYYYSQFLNGTAYFLDDRKVETRMNYNGLSDEIHFINERGDTLAIDNELTLKLVCIDKDTFYFETGFLMLLRSNSTVKLAVKRGFKLVDKKTETGYDLPSSSSSVSSLSSFNDGKVSRQLVSKQQVIVAKTTQYYFGNRFNGFTIANKKNLLNLFHGCATRIAEFSRKNKIDYNNPHHLEKITDFVGNCTSR